MPPLNVLSNNADDIVILDNALEIPHTDKSVEPSATADGTTSDRKSTPSAMVKLLCGVRDSLNGYGPLKSLAGVLCLILENCEVWPPSCMFNHQYLWSLQQTEVDEQAINSLAHRIKGLSELLCTPTPLGDVNEEERERKLNR